MTDRKETLKERLLLEETLPRDRGPKLLFYVDEPDAFAEACRADGQDPDEVLKAWQDAVTPKDRERSDD